MNIFASLKRKYSTVAATDLPEASSSEVSTRISPISGIKSLLSSPNLAYRLASQILLLQVFYYCTAMVMFAVTAILLGWDSGVSLVFSWKEITLENSVGLTLILLWFLNSLFSVAFITFIIGRSKAVWDYALTIHFIHLLIVYACNGLPRNAYWWLLQFFSMILMIVLGTYTTRWIELRDTFFENMNDIEMGGK